MNIHQTSIALIFSQAMLICTGIGAQIPSPAKFPGGRGALIEYLNKEVKFPRRALSSKTVGEVTVWFKVLKTGETDEISITQPLGIKYEEEAFRLVAYMPDWIPAKDSLDHNINSEYFLTLDFDPVNDTVEVRNLERIYYPDDLDEQASFPGGEAKFSEFMRDNLRYPVEAFQAKIDGKFYVGFVISPSGKVTNIHVIDDIGGGCGAEGYRVISLMPDWVPGKVNGKPVSVLYKMPIQFKI